MKNIHPKIQNIITDNNLCPSCKEPFQKLYGNDYFTCNCQGFDYLMIHQNIIYITPDQERKISYRVEIFYDKKITKIIARDKIHGFDYLIINQIIDFDFWNKIAVENKILTLIALQ